MEKQINGRIVHKHDTAENWSKAVNFIPKQGEIIIYDTDENYDYERVKIGNGQSTVNDLPFYEAGLATKEELDPVKQTAENAAAKVETLEDKIEEITSVGGEPNIIEYIKVNGTILEIEKDSSGKSTKTVNIQSIPSSIVNGLHNIATSGNYNDLTNKPTSLKNPNALIIKGDATQTISYDGSSKKTLTIKGSGATVVEADANGNITIKSTDTIVEWGLF